MVNLTPGEARLLAEKLLWALEEDGAGEPLPGALPAGAFGRYHVVRLIGLGGMGAVYEAEQDKPRRRVAIKVIRPELMSAEVARRFEHEARILGRLQHPGIAQIYEAGQVEGGADGTTPYFAMEFVEGVPLTKFARAGGLDVRARLELFLRVCEAVEHAHRMGVIHRDLKPGNILVDGEGRARILDFGVARATDADVRAATMHTEMGRLIGTLPYMSPEQVAGDADGLDTRSDVYSLGVVLYELLAEKPPYDVKRGPVHEAARVIAETEPAPLSTVSRVFRGDLETIVGKALAKERERRYQSVGEMAGDIRRYLNDEPIVARKAGKWYQVAKLMRRNRFAAAATGAAILLLIAGSGTSAWLAMKESEARRQAQKQGEVATRQAQIAEQTASFLGDMFLAPTPQVSMGQELSAIDVLDRSADRAASHPSPDPEVQSNIEFLLAKSYNRLGHPEKAKPLIDDSLSLRIACLGAEHPSTLTALSEQGSVLDNLGDSDKAIDIEWGVLAGRDRVLGPEHPDSIRSCSKLSRYLMFSGQVGDAEPLLERVFLALDSGLISGDREIADCLLDFAQLQFNRGQLDEAADRAERAAELADRTMSPLSSTALGARALLSLILLKQGKNEAGEAVAREVLEDSRIVYGPRHAITLSRMQNLAGALLQLKRYEESESLMRDVIQAELDTQGASHPDTLRAQATMARLLLFQDRYAEARAVLNEVIALIPPDAEVSPRIMRARVKGVMGDSYRKEGNLDEAERWLGESRRELEELVDPGDPALLEADRRSAELARARESARAAPSAGPAGDGSR